jgi:hypothetical protein
MLDAKEGDSEVIARIATLISSRVIAFFFPRVFDATAVHATHL